MALKTSVEGCEICCFCTNKALPLAFIHDMPFLTFVCLLQIEMINHNKKNETSHELDARQYQDILYIIDDTVLDDGVTDLIHITTALDEK